MLEQLTNGLTASRDLTESEVAIAVQHLVDESIPAETKAEFLSALARKGETPGEIAAFARELRAKAIVPPIDEETRQRGILDVCGTGGDHLNTFNISTTVAIVAASAGIPVAKHGNRSVTSQCGSADVLEELGVKIDHTPEQAAAALRETHFAFFFAPLYHPCFRHIAPARKLCAGRGQRTVFNFLGPLLNPVRPAAQLVGVAQPTLCEPLAKVLRELGIQRAMVVSGEVPPSAIAADAEPNRVRHLDELSLMGRSTVAEFFQQRALCVSSLDAGELGLTSCRLQDIAGGDRATNARLVAAVLEGSERGAKREAVLMNAGAGLFVADRVRSITEGIELAGNLIDNGNAFAKLNQLRQSSRS